MSFYKFSIVILGLAIMSYDVIADNRVNSGRPPVNPQNKNNLQKNIHSCPGTNKPQYKPCKTTNTPMPNGTKNTNGNSNGNTNGNSNTNDNTSFNANTNNLTNTNTIVSSSKSNVNVNLNLSNKNSNGRNRNTNSNGVVDNGSGSSGTNNGNGVSGGRSYSLTGGSYSPTGGSYSPTYSYNPTYVADNQPAVLGLEEWEPAALTLELPHEQAEVFLNNARMLHKGDVRKFVTQPLNPRLKYNYNVRVHWIDEEGVRKVHSVTFQFKAGDDLYHIVPNEDNFTMPRVIDNKALLSQKLHWAKDILKDGKIDKGKERLKEIIDSNPDSAEGKEAKDILDKLNK